MVSSLEHSEWTTELIRGHTGSRQQARIRAGRCSRLFGRPAASAAAAAATVPATAPAAAIRRRTAAGIRSASRLRSVTPSGCSTPLHGPPPPPAKAPFPFPDRTPDSEEWGRLSPRNRGPDQTARCSNSPYPSTASCSGACQRRSGPCSVAADDGTTLRGLALHLSLQPDRSPTVRTQSSSVSSDMYSRYILFRQAPEETSTLRLPDRPLRVGTARSVSPSHPSPCALARTAN